MSQNGGNTHQIPEDKCLKCLVVSDSKTQKNGIEGGKVTN